LLLFHADFCRPNCRTPVVRQSVLDRTEDEYDLQVYNTAIAEFRAKAETYSLDEVESELGLK